MGSKSIIDMVYEGLRKEFNDENWSVEKRDNEVILRYESPENMENADVYVVFSDGKVEVRMVEARTDEEIDPVCAPQWAYDKCLDEGRDEKECEKEAEKAEKQEMSKLDALFASNEPYIERISTRCTDVEHGIYIPARAFTVTVQLPDWDEKRVANLIMSLVRDIARS